MPDATDGRSDEPVVRFGILGPGKVAHLHAAALSRIEGARLVGVAGRNQERTRSLAAIHGAEAYPGLDAMIEVGGIDAVILCTPHPLHAEQAIAAAEAGIHVIVEKPMALTPADCDRMIAAADARGVVLSVISQRRWYESVRRVKAAIDAGEIGDPVLASVEVLGWRGPEYYAMDAWRGTVDGEGGGVLVNQAVHQLDLVRWFMGEVVEVDAWTANLNHPGIEVEDSAVAIVRFAGGGLASIIASNSQNPGLHARVHVHGRNGASIGVETDGGSIFVAGVTSPTVARNDLWTIPGQEGFAERWAIEDRAALAAVDLDSHYHELQLRDFVEAIRDRRPPAIDGPDGRKTVELFWAIFRASESGRRVTLASPTG
jgi:UDP-N-acetyl-2-amino-2-deoxyglucuronate dehydrogenase